MARKESDQIKLPSMQWYPADWIKDLGIRSLSFHDRGVWNEILQYMAGSEERGYLVVNGRAMTTEQIAKLIGCESREFAAALKHIEESGVSSRDARGALYSRRMVRDYERIKMAREYGKTGGNPALMKDKGRDNPPPKAGDNPPPKGGRITPISFAFASSASARKTKTGGSLRSPLPAPAGGSGPAKTTPSESKAKTPRKPQERSVNPQATRPPSAASAGASTPLRKLRRTASDNGSNRGNSPAGADPRFDVFRGELKHFWEGLNRESGLLFSWQEAKDSAALRGLLAADPNMKLAELKRSLVNRARSEGVNPAAPFYTWLRDLKLFAAGPLDRYKKPLPPKRTL